MNTDKRKFKILHFYLFASKETLNKSDCRFFSVNYNVANCPQHKELRQFDGKCGLIASSVNQHFP
ncbi:MAG: hypothetical protein IJ630_06740, partial [Treponema sp.]|nr:hypothetical protein [Treponema sp.]